MNMVLKKALGFAGALVLTAGMVLAAAPVQASDVDSRIQALERELAQLKQNQESALAAEMKGPSFKYAAGKGLTIAAADNNWSITFGQRLQLYTSLWGNDNPTEGYQNGVLRVRRFRPNINVSSQQGFYQVNWMFSGKTTVAFNGDGYINFQKTNPWLPKLGWGYNPSFGGNQGNGSGRTEDSLFINSLGLGGSQDASIVLSWKTLPAMGSSKVSFELAVGHDQNDEYVSHPNDDKTDGRSTAFALTVQPLAKIEGMGGFNVSSVKYGFTYESLSNLKHKTGSLGTPITQNGVNLVKSQEAMGDHTYMYHSLGWSPVKWLGLHVHLAEYEADSDAGVASDIEVSEAKLAATVWLWGPKSGMMGGSKKEGGISVSPIYSVAEFDSQDAEATHSGVAMVYNVPGGWMQIHGVYDNYGCEGAACDMAAIAKVADTGKDNFNVFTLIVEYRF